MKYRKKPVQIEAEQYSKLRGLDTAFLIKAVCNKAHDGNWGEPHIHTLEGIHDVRDGDFIIQGVKGEFYPCMPDIFALTYQLVSENDTVAYKPFTVPYKNHIIRKIEGECLVAFPKDMVGYYYSIPRTQKLEEAVKEIESIIDEGPPKSFLEKRKIIDEVD